MEKIEIQKTYMGVITGTQSYGVFVKLGLGNKDKGLYLTKQSIFYKKGEPIIVKVVGENKKGFILKLGDERHLESITIPDGVKIIKGESFSDCKLLESVIIPDSVTAIGESTFYGCNNLKAIYVSKNFDISLLKDCVLKPDNKPNKYVPLLDKVKIIRT